MYSVFLPSKGDSGGPLVCPVIGRDPPIYSFVGIGVHVPYQMNGSVPICRVGYSVFTKVQYYLSWIDPIPTYPKQRSKLGSAVASVIQWPQWPRRLLQGYVWSTLFQSLDNFRFYLHPFEEETYTNATQAPTTLPGPAVAPDDLP